ncbi:peptide chain release factor N(5)-glutamine methyltransferase [Nocardioidaceae bacterium]|nr:peptide chain release factor N(5)-glutamine methyltransferase [Nocardioidaceae bacterium]
MRPPDLLAAAAARLEAAGVPSPRPDAEIMLAHVTGRSRGSLLFSGPVATPQVEAYEALVTRRQAREPLYYLTGLAPFRHLELAVGPGVFVPRPETELLAGAAIDATIEAAGGAPGTHGHSTPVVVDLCTGSGAIAASVAQEVPYARVHAVELEPSALVWAERNLAATSVDLRAGDLRDACPDLDGQVDVVVCNPPYVPLTAFEGVDLEARTHEPDRALFSGEDGLDAVRALEVTAARLLRPGGWLGFEHASEQARTAPGVLVSAGRWTRVRDHADLLDRPRFTTARLRG